MASQRTLELIVLVCLLLGLVSALVAWIRARDKLAAMPDAEAERTALHSAQHALAAEREMTHELRRSVGRLHDERGVLHDPGDTREMVLETAMSILEADKGLLLGRDDGDGDGRLDVVATCNFDHDPTDGDLVQRLGSRVLERDETLRDNRAADDATGADAEIENLVALPVYIHDTFDGVLVCANRRGGFEDLDDDVLLALGDHAGAVLGNSKLRGELRSAYLATVRSLADAIEAKDSSVRTHSEEVARYVAAVANRLDMDPRRREELLFGSLLHDVGKIGISERILLKPGRLTAEEFNIIKLHPRIGHRLVAGIPALAPIAPAVLHHHERFDGAGYPAGLAGERIPLEARIIGVAESFSAMIADRPYSPGRSSEEACAELERCAGTQFDPEVVRLFVEEVRTRPPVPGEPVLDDELAVHRDGDAGPLGSPAFSLVDNLTLLHACGYLHELADAEARRGAANGRPFAIVLAEVEGLDEVNRQAGFAAGDRLLLDVAAGLRKAER
ncbi:MAG: HD domain-containing phosphohydrolase, partial [Solirubrobacteraceae bacterium]